MSKKIYVLGGGTVFHVRPHLALAAPAYGTVAANIAKQLSDAYKNNSNVEVHLGLTKMAAGRFSVKDFEGYENRIRPHKLGETNHDVGRFLERIVADPETSMIFMSVALCDFEGHVLEGEQGSEHLTASGKNESRLKTGNGDALLHLKPADKLIGEIRRQRKDIFLVGFKTTAKETEEEQYKLGLTLLKKNSCNLVLANDVQTGLNMIIAPELAAYSVTHDRQEVVDNLVKMAVDRSTNTFARTKIVDDASQLVPWTSKEVPEVLRKVVDWCIGQNAYKAFNDVTVGHFGYKVSQNSLISSRRKQNFNRIECRDLVKVDFIENQQIAHGAKPSAGARSQYIVLSRFDDLNCIVHFHCPKKSNSEVPVRSQKEFECGSHQCGKNTADGMIRINEHLAAVMLDKHGPNVVFSSKADPQMVIDFIQNNFALNAQTR
jgi:hypothetical protein